VVARFFTRPHIPVDSSSDKAAGNGRAQQEMIDAQAGVAGKRIPEIFPEGVMRSPGCNRPPTVYKKGKSGGFRAFADSGVGKYSRL
jgi:hypothetical protein